MIEKSQNDESSVSSGRPLSASSAKRTSALTKKFKENNNDGDVSSSPAGDLSSSSSPVFLVSMIKDLTQVNDRMKLELSETRDLLEAARNEIQELQNMLYNE